MIVRLANLIPLSILMLGVLAGCKERSLSTDQAGFHLERFSHEAVTEVALNAALVFEFSEPVDPASVNSDTIQIRRVSDESNNERVLDGTAPGTFEVDGRIVSWFPAMSSRPYPVKVRVKDGGPILPDDAGLNSADGGLTYSVVIPSMPHPNTLRTREGQGLRGSHESQFRTRSANAAVDVERLFTRDAPYFRNTLRVADVLAYDGPFSGWSASLVENPLFLDPSRLSDAKRRWTNRDNTGEWVDQAFGIRLAPAMTDARLAQCALPLDCRRRDERLISNTRGARPGRPDPVTGISLDFSQPLPAHTFHGAGSIRVEVATTPTGAEARSVPFTFTLTNEPNSSRLELAFNQPIRNGWIRIAIDATAVSGMPGGALEPNTNHGFAFVWPVRINAE